MDPLTVIAAGNMAGNMFGNLFSGFSQNAAAEKNYSLQRENLAWQKEMQAEAWRRDDTAVQRRAADMAAAGINPLMAAGNAAGNAPVVKTDAPQMDIQGAGAIGKGISEGASNAMAALQMSKDFAVKDAQIQNIQAQTNKTNVEANSIESLLPGNMKLQSADLQLKGSQIKNLAFDLEQLKPAEVRIKTQEIANKLQDIKQSEWFMKNQDKLTQLTSVRDRNEQMLRQAGISESNARLAAMAVELEILRNNATVSKQTIGARSAGAYTDMIKNMDMVKMLGLKIGDPQMFDRVRSLLKQ